MFYLDKIHNNLKTIIIKKQFYEYHKSYIHHTVRFDNINKIKIGNKCQILNNVYINGYSTRKIGISLGKYVRIRENSYIDSYGGFIEPEFGR